MDSYSSARGSDEPHPAGTTTAKVSLPLCRFTPAAHSDSAMWYLVRDADGPSGPERYPLTTTIEIGRDEEGRASAPGLLLVREASVSFRHCLIHQAPIGTCFLRDVSRNGTRVDGRRLVPNVETEVRPGQIIELGPGVRFFLQGDSAGVATDPLPRRGGTKLAPQLCVATVLVGDIRNYTVLVRKAPAAELQRSVSRVFELLSSAVLAHGGTVKEFPGDGLLAFWEGDSRGGMAVRACRAAIDLDQQARRMATDPLIWMLRKHRLEMDWALATGPVSLDSFGGSTPVGLSLIGEPVVLACRLEKFASDRTGRILTCPITRDLANRALREQTPAGEPALDFVDQGRMQAKGFERPDHVFALRVPHA